MVKHILMFGAIISFLVIAYTAPVAQESAAESNGSVSFTVFRSPT